MTGIMFAIFDWFTKPQNRWALWIVFALAFVVTLKWYGAKRAGDGRAQEKQRQKFETAKAETAIVKTITENSNAMVREGDVVRAHDAARELPDGTVTLPGYNYRD